MTKITHEFQFYTWFEKDFPSFTTEEGQKVLEERADEIVGAIDEYFTPHYMERSRNAQYLKEDIEQVRAAYRKMDLKELGKALEGFRIGCKWV